MKTKLTNSFHGTECYVITEDGILTHNQVLSARKKLCGISDCCCGDCAGCRPPQVEQTYQGVCRVENEYRLIPNKKGE